jgi:hypothetical protein
LGSPVANYEVGQVWPPLEVPLMQVLALFIPSLMLVPKVVAATAIPVPTIAKIKAYSAAEAPLSSVTNDFTNLTIKKPLVQK